MQTDLGNLRQGRAGLIFSSSSRSRLRIGDNDTLEGMGCRAERRLTGSSERGHHLLEGRLELPHIELSIPDGNLWQVDVPAGVSRKEVAGFSWLDDLATLRSREAIALAKKWVFDWLNGSPINAESNWQPDSTAWRVIRIRQNEDILLTWGETEQRQQYLNAVKQHAVYLGKRIKDVADGLPRIELLTGLIFAELAGGGSKSKATDAIKKIANAGEKLISEDVGIPTRNPEELQKSTELLQWSALLGTEAGIAAPGKLYETARHSARILRSLRHADGSLARFHSGGNPQPGRLDRVLADSGISHRPLLCSAMGYARITAGSSSIIIDAAAPHSGRQSQTAHASTLAFEFVAGKSPIVVNCGPAASFGKELRQSARETSSHSTIEVNGDSSSRMNTPMFKKADSDKIIMVYPDKVMIEQLPGPDGNTFIASHNGYAPLLGLTHMRRLDINADGTHVWAEDTLWAQIGDDKRVFEEALATRLENKLPFAARFHLHPNTKVEPNASRRRISFQAVGGDNWMFEFDGQAELKVEPSCYFDEAIGQVRKSAQIVLHSGITRTATAQLRWDFKKLGVES